MGHLIYNGAASYEFDDRTLAHLKIAITQKLRVQESFLLSWVEPVDTGSGRVSLWLSSAIPLEFRYSTEKPPPLNRNWLEALARSSHGTRGMIVMTEQAAEEIIATETLSEGRERLRETADTIAESPATSRVIKN
jgi:hypothetical protein